MCARSFLCPGWRTGLHGLLKINAIYRNNPGLNVGQNLISSIAWICEIRQVGDHLKVHLRDNTRSSVDEEVLMDFL